MRQLLIFLAIFLTACNSNKPFEGTVNFEEVKVYRNSKDTETDTTKSYFVDIKYLRPVDAPSYLRDSINKTTYLFMANWFSTPSINDDLNLNTSVKKGMIDFFEYVDKNFMSADICDACRHFELAINNKSIYQNKSLISMAYHWKTFEGGAHGNYAVYCFTFDKKDGSKVGYDRLLKDYDGFIKEAESAFRDQTGMKPDDNMYELYSFEGNKFALSNYYSLTPTGMVLYYNPYEIAPYSAGLIEIKLDYSKIKDFLNYLD